MTENPHYDLLMAFDTDEAEFARGFEAGRIYTLVQLGEDEPEGETMHATNAEMALRIADSHGCTATSEEIGDEWISVRFSDDTNRRIG